MNCIERLNFSAVIGISGMILQNVSADLINSTIAEVGGMVGDIVRVTVDRPLGSYHPVHKDIYYPTINEQI